MKILRVAFFLLIIFHALIHQDEFDGHVLAASYADAVFSYQDGIFLMEISG